MAPRVPTARLCASCVSAIKRFAVRGSRFAVRGSRFAVGGSRFVGSNRNLWSRRDAGDAEARVEQVVAVPKRKDLGNGSARADSTPLRLLRLCDKAVCGSRLAVGGSTLAVRGLSAATATYGVAETQGTQRLVSSRSLRFPKERILGKGSARADSTPLRPCASAIKQFAVRSSGSTRGERATRLNAKLAEALEERRQQPQQGNLGDAGGAEARVEQVVVVPQRRDFGEWLRTCRPETLRPLRLCD